MALDSVGAKAMNGKRAIPNERNRDRGIDCDLCSSLRAGNWLFVGRLGFCIRVQKKAINYGAKDRLF